MAIWAGIVTNNVTTNRINIIFYPYLIITAVGIYRLIQKWRLSFLPIGLAYGVSAMLFLFTYFGEWTEISRTYYYEPYLNALFYAKTLDCDVYNIFPYPQDPTVKMVGEILTMYSHEIDALYYQGKTNMLHGEEYLPYTERYIYTDINADLIASNEQSGKNVVYLTPRDSVHLFPDQDYDKVSFYDAYFVVSGKLP